MACEKVVHGPHFPIGDRRGRILYSNQQGSTQRMDGWITHSITDNIKFVDAVDTGDYTEFFGYDGDESELFFRSEHPEISTN